MHTQFSGFILEYLAVLDNEDAESYKTASQADGVTEKGSNVIAP